MVSILDGPLTSVGVRGLQRIGESSSAIATNPAGHPLGPFLKKDWTSIPGTHTDGDGGDNETYDWEEVAE